MSLLHTLSLLFTSFLLRFTLFATFSTTALVLVFSNGEIFKNALVDTNAYERAVDSIIATGAKQSNVDPDNQILNDPEVRSIIKNSFNSGSISPQVERSIDNIYSWLNNDSPELKFSIDLTSNKDNASRQLAEYSINRLSGLPVCTEIPQNKTIFSLTCIPPYVDLSEQKIEVYKAILNDPTFLPDAKITQNTLPEVEGKRVYEKYSDSPKYFSLFKASPWVLLALSLALSIIVVLLSRTRRNGLKRVASALITTGIVLAVTPLIGNFITPRINNTVQSALTDESSIGFILNDINNHLYKDVNSMLINMAIIALVVGVSMLLVLKITRDSMGPYRMAEERAGLATSISPPSSTKGIKQHDVPVQSSERKYKPRKPGKKQKKYRKL